MTTLYRPVPITSAEQAEALPVGSISPHPDRLPVEKIESGTWWGSSNFEGLTSEDMVGQQALVPIEAEEESEWRDFLRAATGAVGYKPHTRLVTPWEPATDRRGDCA